MNFKVSTGATKDKDILYLLEFDIEDKRVVKVGVTNREVEERVCEILTSIWKWYRVFPRLYVKRYRRTEDAYRKEKELLDMFKDHKYEPEYKFSGSTELLWVQIDKVVEAYDLLVPSVKYKKNKSTITQTYSTKDENVDTIENDDKGRHTESVTVKEEHDNR